MSQTIEALPFSEIAQPIEYPRELPEEMNPDQWLSLYSNVLHDLDKVTEGSDPTQREALRDLVERTAFNNPESLWGIFDSMRDSDGNLKTKARTMAELIAERDEINTVEEIYSRPSVEKPELSKSETIGAPVDSDTDPKHKKLNNAAEKIRQFKTGLVDLLLTQGVEVGPGGPPVPVSKEQVRLIAHSMAMKGILRSLPALVGVVEMPTARQAFEEVRADNERRLAAGHKK
ncbi:MAG TPA: hypothetical protein VIH90_07835 [Candidatus Saccharimonadales bacterium]